MAKKRRKYTRSANPMKKSFEKRKGELEKRIAKLSSQLSEVNQILKLMK